jgi:hypothetical protein
MTATEITYLPPCDRCGHPASQHQRELRCGKPIANDFSCHARGCKCRDWDEPAERWVESA